MVVLGIKPNGGGSLETIAVFLARTLGDVSSFFALQTVSSFADM